MWSSSCCCGTPTLSLSPPPSIRVGPRFGSWLVRYKHSADEVYAVVAGEIRKSKRSNAIATRNSEK